MDQANACVPSGPVNVRSIKELVDAGLAQVPARYVRPVHERPRCLSASTHSLEVPVVSLNTTSRSHLLQEIAAACSDWGVFQVVDHGVCSTLQSQLWSEARKFFALPMDDKMDLISKDPSCPLLFFTGFYAQENVKEWKDTLGYKPSFSSDHNLIPFFLREPMLKFHDQMRILSHMLCKSILSSLGEESTLFANHLLRETMALNYYPSCPDPELTYGLSSHSDFGSITIIMQDDVKGLQVRKNDVWVDIEPKPNSFIVMLGDQLEILTNGHYKSVEHRVVTNRSKPRMSIACFYAPDENDIVKPLDKFVTKDRPTMYKETNFNDYLKNGFSTQLNGKANLQSRTIQLD